MCVSDSDQQWWIVADVGGTNVRFARADVNANLNDLKRYSTGDFSDFQMALATYFTEVRDPGSCCGVAIAAAGPVDGERVALTNLPWVITRDDVLRVVEGAAGRRLDDERVVLMNDLAAVAAGLMFLHQNEVMLIGGPSELSFDRGPMLAVNVGTGFGAATVLPFGDSWCIASSEAGHMTFALDKGEDALLDLRGQSVESFLSGPGVVEAYDLISEKGGNGSGVAHAGEIFDQVEVNKSARQVVELFTHVLGRICGDLVLASGAWGGVYLTGSVVRSWGYVCSQRDFRKAFEAKGLMRDRMQKTPTYIISLDDPALIGLARFVQ